MSTWRCFPRRSSELSQSSEPGRSSELARNAAALGRSGEDAAASWYVAAGFEVLARNWRCAQGEIDLVVKAGRTLVVCEVKARTSDRFGSPFEAIGAAKRQRLRRLAARYLSEERGSGRLGPIAGIRFDVVGVTDGVVEVCEGAF